MTNVQWKDPQLRRRRGSPASHGAFIRILRAALPAESFDSPRCEGLQPFRGFREPIICDSRRLP
jgi:hypothetical protein